MNRTSLIATTASIALGFAAIPTLAAAIPCTATADDYGILAISFTGGAITVISNQKWDVPPSAPGNTTVGIFTCTAVGAPTNITISGDIDSHNGPGIVTLTDNGPISIKINTGNIAGKAGDGILAQTFGAQNIVIETATGTIVQGSAGNYGVVGESLGGDVTLNLGGRTVGPVFASTTLAGDAFINIADDVNSGAGDAVTAFAIDGDAQVNTLAGAAIASSNGSGIVALSQTGDVAITTKDAVTGTVGVDAETGAAGTVDVTLAGGGTTGSFGVGLFTRSETGATNVTVWPGVLVGTTDGIDAATTTGALNINLLSGASVTALGGDGVLAQTAGGAFTLQNAGTIDGGVNASAGKGFVTVGNTGVIQDAADTGLIASSKTGIVITNGTGGQIRGDAGIKTSGAGTVTITNAGYIASTDPTHKGLAIKVGGAGGMTLNNTSTGLIDGRIKVADHSTFNNAGFWLTRGNSDFGGGGTANTLTNTGTVRIGLDGPATKTSDATFANLDAFNNGSKTATGIVSMANGRAGDTLTLSGDFVGAKGHSILALDAFLGGPGSVADVLNIGGKSSGQTLIQIHDTNTGAGAVNKDGITLVTGAGKNDFDLDPSQPNYNAKADGIDHGLFTYQIKAKGGDVLLTSKAGVKALQLPLLVNSLLDVFLGGGFGDLFPFDGASGLALQQDGPRAWMDTSNWRPDSVNAHREGLWDSALTGPADAAPMGSLVSRNAVALASTGEPGLDAGYAQSTSRLTAGYDLVRHRGDGAAFTAGVTGGYVQSDLAFREGGALVQFGGASMGAYARYSQGGWRLRGDVRADMMRAHYLAAQAGGQDDGTASVFGMRAEAAYVLALGPHWSLEPWAGGSLARVAMPDLNLYGTAVSFQDGQSTRASVGLRLAGQATYRGWRGRLTAGASLTDELSGVASASLGDTAPDMLLTDSTRGVFGDAQARLDFTRGDGRVAGFVASTFQSKPQYDASMISAGLRLTW